MFEIDSLYADEIYTPKFSWQAALSAAFAAQLSYENRAIAEAVPVEEWGFAEAHYFDNGPTQGFVGLSERTALVVFRGTKEPADWLSNFRVFGVRRDYGVVHSGFYHAFEDVREQIFTILTRRPAPAIWLTGHSLGGALATIAAAEMFGRFPIAGVYTFGQPRLVNDAAGKFFDQNYSDTFHRFVNANDIITRIPRSYRHVGALIRFDRSGGLLVGPGASSDTGIDEPQFDEMFEFSRSGVFEGVFEGAIEAVTTESGELEPLSDAQLTDLQDRIKAQKSILAGARDSLTARTALEAVEFRDAALSDEAIAASVEGIIPGVSNHAMSAYISRIQRQLPASSTRAIDDILLAESAQPLSAMRSAFEFGGGAFEATPDVSDETLYAVNFETLSHDWRPPTGFKMGSRLGAIVTGQATAIQLQALRDDPEVRSLESSREAGVEELSTSLAYIGAASVQQPPTNERGDAALIGVIDSGVDIFHRAFDDENGNSRILAIWDQADPTGPTPFGVDSDAFTQNYGTLHLYTDIAAMRSGARDIPDEFLRFAGHGTHVASIAAGRKAGAFTGGVAPEARLVVVRAKIKTSSPEDPKSIGYSNAHMDGLSFLKRISDGGTAVSPDAHPMAINVSLGMNAGAHDGSSKLERWFNNATNGGTTPGIVIIKSAGNERPHKGHARVRAIEGGVVPIKWTSANEKRNEDYFEAWFSSFDALAFTLTTPGGGKAGPVSLQSPTVDLLIDRDRIHMGLLKNHPDNGLSRLTISVGDDDKDGRIRPGLWRLDVTGERVRTNGQIDIWVERVNSRPVAFEDANDEMTLSIPGTTESVITVGACQKEDPLRLIDVSSKGRTRDNRDKPDLCAPGGGIIAALAKKQGINSTPDHHEAVISQTGTSMAAPHVTGLVALALSRRAKQPGKRQFNANQLRAVLRESTRALGAGHHEGFGYGLVDAKLFFEFLD